MNRETFLSLIPDYVDGTLSPDVLRAFETYLASCDDCQGLIEDYRSVGRGLKQMADDAQLSDESRLRLYERFNEERARRGESLIRIPADLLARVKAKAVRAPEAARKAVSSGKEATVLAAGGGKQLAVTTGRGGKRFGGKMKQGTVNMARHTAEVAKEMGKTVADVGRITTKESYEVLREVPRGKRQALLAPPKLMGKGMKAGLRLMTGTAKVATKTVKGGAVMTKDAASTMATGMVESARLGKAVAESTDAVVEATSTLTEGLKDAAKTVAEG